MEIKKVISDKKEFLELLLLADEQESMIDRYLERGDMFVLYDNGLKACCVVTREGEGIYEIKNIATISFFQRHFRDSAYRTLICRNFYLNIIGGNALKCWSVQAMHLLRFLSTNIVASPFPIG